MVRTSVIQSATTSPSIHERALGAYVRTPGGGLIRCVGPHSQWIQGTWSAIRSTVTATSPSLAHCFQVCLPASDADFGLQDVDIYERQRANTKTISIDVTATTPRGVADPPVNLTVERIVDLFDKELRYRVQNDQWATEGRNYFAAKVRFFVNHNSTLQLCLPAFPCKSSNQEKVVGILPDRGEEIALRRLHAFAHKIEQLYRPGARILIISDGHVFSDCIGVDDATVDEYGEHLKVLNQAISLAMGENTERVQFQSLVDLFNLTSLSPLTSPNAVGMLNLPELQHYLTTSLGDLAELCRRILVAGCQPSEDSLRTQIESGDESTLALYRGFSRFMLQDLDRHPLTQSLSRSQRKKLATRVSFEMILRNQAYSNLIELIFPDCLRLSIHAHNNAGPKFGIRLFDTATVRTIRQLDSVGSDDDNGDEECTATASHLLHIPTPWHNCIVEVAGDPKLYIVKYGVVKHGPFIHKYSSHLIKGNLAKGEGAFVSLKRSSNLTRTA
ncbi:Pyoverdine/dityrosine biosynthesis protein-domain-containing protein [Aspergillus pseudotamarii]|uniref:Pyoverdine/dityrosine biosynthesis protein-domain-containing protein n=1 Tax=Aspergillus pseudotamarii TaxID=132259 RepID=A0A5N6SXR8_ASPPS|nr:Pyoverdine/dityrosine biosynthesis protein-domain-containing protein [Aspergillus pseudotamarii]KAE8138589.1 Pyoverdine/dityrosine biosynthesis protein-domain-containing protein [Aspergillus pseudotamarii]